MANTAARTQRACVDEAQRENRPMTRQPYRRLLRALQSERFLTRSGDERNGLHGSARSYSLQPERPQEQSHVGNGRAIPRHERTSQDGPRPLRTSTGIRSPARTGRRATRLSSSQLSPAADATSVARASEWWTTTTATRPSKMPVAPAEVPPRERRSVRSFERSSSRLRQGSCRCLTSTSPRPTPYRLRQHQRPRS